MRAVLNYPPVSSFPVGIWWVDSEGHLQSYYPDGESPFEILGRQLMSQWEPERTSWEQYTDRLGDITPIIAGWMPVETNDPQLYLDAQRSAVGG